MGVEVVSGGAVEAVAPAKEVSAKVEVEAGPQTRAAQSLTTQEKLALLQELWEEGQGELPEHHEP